MRASAPPGHRPGLGELQHRFVDLCMKNLFLTAAAAVLLALPALAQPSARPQPALQTQAAGPQATGTFVLLLDREQTYRAGAWADTFRTTNSRFTAGNLPARILRETSTNGSTWASVRRNHRQYSATNLLLTDTTYSFNATTGAATARFMSAKTYNAAGKITQSTLRFYLSSWQDYGRDSYTYDANGYLTRLLLEGYAGGYYPSSQTLYTNDAQGRPTVIEDQQDNGSGTAWLLAAKDLLTYNAAGQVAQVVGQNVPSGGTAYQNYRRETYTYDPAVPTRLLSTTVEAWSNGTWVPAGLNTWAYDADGNISTLTTQVATAGAPRNYYRHLYTYQRVLANAPARPLNAALALAPNPAAAGTTATLSYVLPAAAPVAVQVFDALGRLVLAVPAAAEAAGDRRRALPLPATAGCYTLRLSAGAQSQTLKLVVQ